jgi:predicted DsbA family dithiol-disulfide isomerase
MSARVTLDIWSDVMCPWCLIGWGGLSAALDELAGEIEAQVHWRAFELNPDMPTEGEERTAHIARKYGRTPDQARGVQGQMAEAARKAGVSLEYAGGEPAPPAMMWNTFDAHKLLAWAYETGGSAVQTQLKLALFDAHFHQRRRIGDPRVVAQIAGECGLDMQGASDAMVSDRYAAIVRDEQRQAWDANITGVPAVVVDGAFLIPGAQSADVYADSLRRIVAKRAA